MPREISLSDKVIGLPMTRTGLGRLSSFLGNGSCGHETCLLMVSLTDGMRRIVMDGLEDTSVLRAVEMKCLKTVDMVAVSVSEVSISSGRSKSPVAISGWSMSMNGPERIRVSM